MISSPQQSLSARAKLLIIDGGLLIKYNTLKNHVIVILTHSVSTLFIVNLTTNLQYVQVDKRLQINKCMRK